MKMEQSILVGFKLSFCMVLMVFAGLHVPRRSLVAPSRRTVRVQANLFERIVRVAKSYANALGEYLIEL